MPPIEIKINEQQEDNNSLHFNKMFNFKESNIFITIIYLWLPMKIKFDNKISNLVIVNEKI